MYQVFTDFDSGKNESLTWFNPNANIRTIYANSFEEIRHIELFNSKTSIFSYSDYLNGNISLRFQLLEATGWDKAYQDSNGHLNEGVYKDGVMLFKPDEYLQFNVYLNETFGLVNGSVTIDLKKSELTNDILNMSQYKMNFNHEEINMKFIENSINNSYDESLHLQNYRGIKFYDGDVKEEFLSQMNKDLRLEYI